MENPKCNGLLGGINALGVTDRQIHLVSGISHWADNGNLENFEAVANNVTAFEPKQSLYQKLVVSM